VDFMPSEGNDRVEKIRAKVCAERRLISDLDGKIKDASIKQLLQRASCSLDDVQFLVRSSLQAQTPAYVSMWLSSAEVVVQIAAQQRKVVEDIVAKYGPDGS
jgi:hypothetical protein